MFETNHILLSASGTGQDRLEVLNDGHRAVFALADGAGGRSGGAEAADLVIQLARERATDLHSAAACEQVLGEVDSAISSDKVAGETTAVIVVADRFGVFGASAGDSGAWILSLTNTDNLTGAQMRKPFLGTGAARAVGFSRPNFQGTLLVATDGLLKYTSREAIANVVARSSLRDLPEALVNLVRYPSGSLPDDLAIGLCRPV